jgi:hypothetical protein
MNHPEREEWVPFICHETDPVTRQRLAEHLTECPQCAHEVAAWQRGLKQLDHWRVHKPGPSSAPSFGPVLRWAIAAAVLLACGILIGRTTARPHLDSQWQTQINASVNAALQARLEENGRQLQAQYARDLAQAETRLSAATVAQGEQLWRNVVELLASARAQDSTSIRAALHSMEERRTSEFVALRKDLETLASMTDEEIRAARLKLVQLAAYQSSNQ